MKKCLSGLFSSLTNWCLSLRVEVSCHCETSPQTGRGNPPDRGEMYRQLPNSGGNVTIFGGNFYLVPLIGGIATPVCALARNDSVYLTNTNLSLCRNYSGFGGRCQQEGFSLTLWCCSGTIQTVIKKPIIRCLATVPENCQLLIVNFLLLLLHLIGSLWIEVLPWI